MSQYFDFYLARKDKDGKFHYVAPYIMDATGNFKPKSLLTRSRSFIEQEDFEDMGNRIALEEMDETIRSLGTNRNWNDEEYSVAWAISYKRMVSAGYGHGMYQGYVSVEDFNFLKENNFIISDRWEVNELVEPEVVAELGKNGLVKVAFIATNDTSYIAQQLSDSVQEMFEYELDEEEYYFIFTTEY